MRTIDLLSVSSGASLLPVVDAVAKATILLATAGLLSVVLRRRSAAARHLVWTLALLGALVLPALSIALPRWQVGLIEVASVGSQLPASSFELPAPGVQPSLKRDVGMQRPEGSAAETRTAAAPRSNGGSRLSQISWPAALLLLWALGAGVILARLAAGLVAVQWMSRRTERVTDAPWLPQARALAAELGISPRIVFLRSGRAAMPMALGIFRPAVLMPSDADHWPAERLRIVLLHELAHVKRRDCLTHGLAQIACAAYWFNPLAWIAARHLRTERERACDDLVLASGTRGADYADQLLEVARVMRAGRFPAVLAGASLAMAHRSQLEGRLIAILDPGVPRSGISRVRTSLATLVFAVAVMPLASLQPWTVGASTAQEVPVVAAPAVPAVSAPRPAPQIADPTRVSATPPVKSAAVAKSVQPDVTAVVAGGIRQGITVGITQGVANSVVAGVKAGVVEGVTAGIVNGVIEGINASVAGVTDGVAAAAQRKPADPRTVAALTAALKDSDKDVRETALHALVQLRDPSIFEPLVQALSDANADVREEAAHGLGQLRDRRAIEPLTAAVKDSDADVREQAVFALGQLRDRSTLPALTAALKDANPDVRQQAVFALGQLRDRRAVEPLISALKDTDADVREQAAFGLGQIRDRGAVEALVIALKDSVADVRQQAAFALGQLRDPRAIDGLTNALKDSSVDVRRQAAFALGQLAR